MDLKCTNLIFQSGKKIHMKLKPSNINAIFFVKNSQLNIQKDILVHYVDSDYKFDAYEMMMSQYDYLDVNKSNLGTSVEKVCSIKRHL